MLLDETPEAPLRILSEAKRKLVAMELEAHPKETKAQLRELEGKFYACIYCHRASAVATFLLALSYM